MGSTGPVAEGVFALGGTLTSPVMLCRATALDGNVSAMARYAGAAGVLLAPHAKTAMSPEIVGRQLAAGAWGLTAATGSQVQSLRGFGVRNVLLANELIDPAAIAWIAADLAAHPDHRFLGYVDSIAGAELLEQSLVGADVRLDLLLEVGASGGRTGCRTVDGAVAVAERVAASAALRLVGVAGYEGSYGADRTPESLTAVRSFLGHLGEVASTLDAAGLLRGDAVILSAGGGVYFDVAAEQLTRWRSASGRPASVIIRPGSYVAHDDGIYAASAPFARPDSEYRIRPALELWGRVLSRPEPEVAFLDVGRRDAPFDSGLPIPRTVRAVDGSAPRPAGGLRVLSLNDQHAYLAVPAEDPLRPGEWVGCGISHPCTAFDKWRRLPLVDDEYRVVGEITTFF